MASLRNLNGESKMSAAQQAQYNPKSFFSNKEAVALQSTSLNFIKNKTGEILLFKSGRQPAFTEMQANETLPLDF